MSFRRSDEFGGSMAIVQAVCGYGKIVALSPFAICTFAF